MWLKFGMTLSTSDNRPVGVITRLYIERTPRRVAAVLLRHDHLLQRDSVVPLDRLPTDAFQPARLSVLATDRQAQPYRPIEGVVLDQASSVWSADGHLIGRLRQLTFDTPTGGLVRLVILTAPPLADEDTLPASLIASIDDGALHLSVTAAWLAAWRQLGGGQSVWTSDGVCLGMTMLRLPDGLEVIGAGSRPIFIPLAAIAAFPAGHVLLRPPAGDTATTSARPGSSSAAGAQRSPAGPQTGSVETGRAGRTSTSGGRLKR